MCSVIVESCSEDMLCVYDFVSSTFVGIAVMVRSSQFLIPFFTLLGPLRFGAMGVYSVHISKK